MILIKNARAWKRLQKQHSGDDVSPPKEYPCFVYFTVLSFGYEEERANYLYLANIESMLRTLHAL